MRNFFRVLIILCLVYPYSAFAGLYGQSAGGTYGVSAGSIYGQSVSSDTSLDTTNTYGQNCLLMYVFDGTGTNVPDYSGNSDDGTLSSDIHTSEGALFDSGSDRMTAPNPTLGDTFTVFLVFKSADALGVDFGTFWADNDDFNEWQLTRPSSDTSITARFDSNDFAEVVDDMWDQADTTIAVTYNRSTPAVKIYVDGAYEDQDTTAWAALTLGANLTIGNDDAGSYNCDGTIGAFYVWSTELSASDISSLHNDPYQMFNNPPTRAWTGAADTTAPTVSSAFTNVAGTEVTIVFSESMVMAGYDAGDLEIDCTTTGNDIDLTSPTGSGSTWSFTSASTVVNGETCTLEYDADVSADDMEDAAGNDLATFSGESVTNNVPVDPPGDADILYCTQAGAGSNASGTGAFVSNPTSAGQAMSVAQFNNAVNWDTDVSEDYKIGPSDVVYFSGTFTDGIVPPGNGSSGNLITLDGYAASDPDIVGGASYADFANLYIDSGYAGMWIEGRSYLHIKNFQGSSNTAANDNGSIIQIQGPSNDNITVTQCQADNIIGRFIGVGGSGNTYITIGGADGDGNLGYNCGVLANSPWDSQHLTMQGVTDGIVSYNKMYNDASTEWKSQNIMTAHNSSQLLIEYNDFSYPWGQSCLAMKENGNTDYIIRFNHLHNSRYPTGGPYTNGVGLDIYHSNTDNFYVYGNYIHDVVYGIQVARGADNGFIWGNLFEGLPRQGVSSYQYTEATISPTENIHFYNNTFANIATQPTGYDNTSVAALTAAGSYATSEFTFKNNIVFNSRVNATDHNAIYIPSYTDQVCSFEHNKYYVDSDTPTFYWDGSQRTLAQLQALGEEDDSPAGVIEDPGFVNDNSDWTLDGTNIDDAATLTDALLPDSGDPVTIMGVTYCKSGCDVTLSFTEGPNPATWDFSSFPPVVDMISRGASWEHGAFPYVP